MNTSGILGKTYHEERKSRRSLIYRLHRRTEEVIDSIRKHSLCDPSIILDLGTADGLMLSKIQSAYPFAECTGIELSMDLIKVNGDRRITLLQGDVSCLPVSDNTVDVLVATAVIEHLDDPARFLKEAWRVLKSQGLIILTAPHPFWEKIASITGHLKEEQHCKVMNIEELAALFKDAGYNVLEKKRFMLSPVGMPLEHPVESFVRKAGLHFLFANQLLVGKK